MTDDTLDPPGKIAILGGGPIGIEAALYARYLGYSVVLFEAEELAQRLRTAGDSQPPKYHASPLGLAAVAAQRGLGGTSVELEVESCADWAREYFERIADSDLLAGRVRTRTKVERLEFAPEEDLLDSDAEEEEDREEEDEDETPVPPDFLVHYVDAEGGQGVERVEAVIDARGERAAWIGPGESPTDPLPPYLYPIGGRAAAETDFHGGLVQIRQLFAKLWDRPGLDVYANLGGEV